MNTAASFDEILDAIERLSADEQAELLEVARRRLAERGRERIAQDAREAREEYASGKAEPKSASDLMGEIES